MTYVAQEKEGLQDAEDVSAAIQETISPIETELESKMTVLPTQDFGTLKDGDSVTLPNIRVGELQIYTFELENKNIMGSSDISVYYPSGGEYLNDIGEIVSGGSKRTFNKTSIGTSTFNAFFFRLM